MVDETEEAVWKTYPGIDFLQANQFGEVRTVDHYTTRNNGIKQFVKGHVLKQYANHDGYMLVNVGVNGKIVHLRVHRIVATCFLPNPDNLPEVNHKDCNRTNNNVSNLEFCTSQYNTAYREKCGVSAKEATKVLRKPLFAVNLKTFEVLRFESQSEASRQLGVSQGNINSVLQGRRKQTDGYWFTEDENEITEEKIQEVKDREPNYKLKAVIAIDLKTLKVSRFKSQREASQQLGVAYQNINKVRKCRRKTAGGYWFCDANSEAVEKTRAKFGDEVASEVEKLINEKL